jgi:hypothetical protein
LLLELASHGTNNSLAKRCGDDFSNFRRLIYTAQEAAVAIRVARRLGIEMPDIQEKGGLLTTPLPCHVNPMIDGARRATLRIVTSSSVASVLAGDGWPP